MLKHALIQSALQEAEQLLDDAGAGKKWVVCREEEGGCGCAYYQDSNNGPVDSRCPKCAVCGYCSRPLDNLDDIYGPQKAGFYEEDECPCRARFHAKCVLAMAKKNIHKCWSCGFNMSKWIECFVEEYEEKTSSPNGDGMNDETDGVSRSLCFRP